MNVSPKGRKKSDIGKDYNKHWLIQVHGVHCQLYLLPLIKNRFVHTLDIFIIFTSHNCSFAARI